MTILTDWEIKKALSDGLIEINPPPTDLQFNSCALDLHIGDGAKIWKRQAAGAELTLTVGRFNYAESAGAYLEDVRIEGGKFLIRPGEFLLVLTREKVFLKPESTIMAWVQGKSSLARMGLQVHLTAPTIHVGFKGHITLELLNSGGCTLAFEVGKSLVCQLIFQRVGGVPDRQQGSFQGQQSVTGR